MIMQTNSHTVPELNTNLVAPLQSLERTFLSQCSQIESWFHSQWQQTPPPIYGSVDLRNAGFILAPIDMNLFPASFNNLNPNFISISLQAAKKIIQRIAPNAKRILVIPESHTRNLFYWANIKTLQNILEAAELEVRFGILS